MLPVNAYNRLRMFVHSEVYAAEWKKVGIKHLCASWPWSWGRYWDLQLLAGLQQLLLLAPLP